MQGVNMNQTRVILLTMILAVFSGCGKSGLVVKNSQAEINTSQDLGNGIYADHRCVYNGPISRANTQDLYTTDVLTLNADGTGEKTFSIFTDAKCTTLLTSGTTMLKVSVAAKYGNIEVVQMIQGDPAKAPTQTFYIPAYAVANGYYLDVDGSLDGAGPYSDLPSAEEVGGFQADPTGQGVLFTRQ
jgi:hypothetical protein